MKNIKIYLVSNYDNKTKIGKWAYYLEYKGAVKKESGYINDAKSSARMLLIALIQAIMNITEPCNIIVVSKTHLGFKNIKNSPNRDLLLHIHDLIYTRGHSLSPTVNSDYSCVDDWENEAKLCRKRAEDSYYDRLAQEHYMMTHQYEYL